MPTLLKTKQGLKQNHNSNAIEVTKFAHQISGSCIKSNQAQSRKSPTSNKDKGRYRFKCVIFFKIVKVQNFTFWVNYKPESKKFTVLSGKYFRR